MIEALAFYGVPPAGLGVYGRDRVLAAPFRWRAVNGLESSYARNVDIARRLGPVWLWTGPSHWTPREWQSTLALMVQRCQETGCSGIIVDPEDVWASLASGDRRAQLSAFGVALGAAALRVRVGVTSFPSFPDIETLAHSAGGGVWGSPQIYGRTSVDPADFVRWFARWQAAFGRLRVIPSIAGWDSSTNVDERAEYEAYLASIPRAAGAIVWPVGNMPPHMQAVLASYSPGGSVGGTAALAAATFLARPAAAVALAALIALAIVFLPLLRK